MRAWGRCIAAVALDSDAAAELAQVPRAPPRAGCSGVGPIAVVRPGADAARAGGAGGQVEARDGLIASLLTGEKAPREGEGEATAPKEEDALHGPATQVARRRAPAAPPPRALRG